MIFPTFDQIMREAANFVYLPICQDYSCTDQKKACDSLGMSNWLYTELIDYTSRIISYNSPYFLGTKFYCVQYLINNNWIDLPYSDYNFDSRFVPTGIRNNLCVENGN
jgi:hypothetical protein